MMNLTVKVLSMTLEKVKQEYKSDVILGLDFIIQGQDRI